MKKSMAGIRLCLEDVLLINLAYLLSLYIRFDAIIDETFLYYLSNYWRSALLITILKVVVFYYFKMYRTVWKYASIKELFNIVIAIVVSNAVVLSVLYMQSVDLPKSIYLITVLLDLVMIGGLRFSYRTLDIHNITRIFNRVKKKRRIMIVGAGDAGVMIIREYRNHPQLESKPLVLIDDDRSKHNLIINGVLVAGAREDIESIAEKYEIDEIIIALPSASKKDISDIIDISKRTSCKLKIVPGLYELIDGNVTINKIRDVEIEDLLGRDEIKVDLDEISSYISNKVVMVTASGQAQIEVAKRAKELLDKVNANIIGAVLNKIPIEDMGQYSYGYYAYAYAGNSDSKDKVSRRKRKKAK